MSKGLCIAFIKAAKNGLVSNEAPEKLTSEAKQAAEKGEILCPAGKERTAGAKAQIHFAAFTARLKSCPVTKRSISAAYKVNADSMGLVVRPKVLTYQFRSTTRTSFFAAFIAIAVLFAAAQVAQGAPRKAHVVVLGVVRRVGYSKAGDPAGAAAGEDALKIRALVVDGQVKEWTTGEAHDVTDRSFVVRRVLRLNDALPGDKQEAGEKPGHWVWQRGPWLLVDRASGHIAALKLPDYDPGVSQVSWFRDYGAYCGVTASGKSLYAVVAQLAARKPVLAKKLEALDAESRPDPACGLPEWQREPLRVTFHRAGKDAVGFDIVPGSAVLVEDTGDEPDSAPPGKPN